MRELKKQYSDINSRMPEAISAEGLTPPLIQACFSPPIEVGVISQLIYIVNKERCICYARYTRG